MWVVVGCTLTVATALLTVTTLLAALIAALLTALITTLLTGLIATLFTIAVVAWTIATLLLARLIATLLAGLITALLTGLVAATIIITRAIAAWLAATRSALEIGSKALGAETTLLIVVTIITVGACGANTGTLWSGAYTLLLL